MSLFFLYSNRAWIIGLHRCFLPPSVVYTLNHAHSSHEIYAENVEI